MHQTTGCRNRTVSRSETIILWQEASRAATRLVRRLGLARDHHDDIHQDLLLDLLLRLKWFDPLRGSLGAFAGRIVLHRATRLAARIRRERRVLLPLNEEITSTTELLPDAGFNPFTEVERAIDRERASEILIHKNQGFRTRKLRLRESPDPAGPPSRATLYRQRRDEQLILMMAGLSPNP